ncbi:uncharacterized protein [Montipora foliosa]|uniref:uncharacterized protein n=1 Tax=Montipora foliosa TaxID=591990 RepID=UPI0035F1EE2E
MRKSGNEANKARYKNIKNRAKKVVAKAMKEAAEQELRWLRRCMRGSNGRLSFSNKDRGKVWKEHMERIMNEENEWDQNVKGPVERVSRKEVVKAMGEMKAGKAAGPSGVSLEMIVANGEIGIGVMVELCQGVLDGRGMLDEWALSVVGPKKGIVVGNEEERYTRGNGERAVMTLYEGAKTRVRVGLELSKEFDVKVGVHQGSVLSPLVKNGLMSEMLYADDLVFMSEAMEGLREKFWK